MVNTYVRNTGKLVEIYFITNNYKQLINSLSPLINTLIKLMALKQSRISFLTVVLDPSAFVLILGNKFVLHCFLFCL